MRIPCYVITQSVAAPLLVSRALKIMFCMHICQPKPVPVTYVASFVKPMLWYAHTRVCPVRKRRRTGKKRGEPKRHQQVRAKVKPVKCVILTCSQKVPTAFKMSTFSEKSIITMLQIVQSFYCKCLTLQASSLFRSRRTGFGFVPKVASETKLVRL